MLAFGWCIERDSVGWIELDSVVGMAEEGVRDCLGGLVDLQMTKPRVATLPTQ